MTLDGRAATIACPTLVVAGRLDRLTPLRDQVTLHQSVEGSELRLYDDGNHTCATVASIYRPAAADWLLDALA